MITIKQNLNDCDDKLTFAFTFLVQLQCTDLCYDDCHKLC